MWFTKILCKTVDVSCNEEYTRVLVEVSDGEDILFPAHTPPLARQTGFTLRCHYSSAGASSSAGAGKYILNLLFNIEEH